MQTNGLRGFAATLATWMLISGAMALMAQTTTTTTLSMSAGASSLQSGGSLVWGGVLTLQATISNGSTPVTLGLVNFCDATAAQCTDVHVLGSSQLTSAGTAVFKFRPGQGTHSYKAVFVGTNSYATSSSASQTLTLTAGSGQYPTDALLSNTGTWGNYTLTATVEDFGATSPLTGGITIEDTSNGNAPLATAPLGPSTPGLFWATQAPCTNAVGSNYIAAADFNGDGYLDFATIEASLNEVLIFDYQPNLGCYEETGSYTAGSGPDGIYLADFNGDGIPDIVIPDASTYSITILLGNGDGTFKVSSLATSHINTYIAIADFNGDGIPDLAVADEFDGGVSIYLGNGDGTFTAAASLTTSSSMSLATGDFNGDGNVDIAVAVGSAVDVFLGTR